MSTPTPASLPAFSDLKRVHVIGVCGTLMGAFAAFLKRRGIEVTGSDQNVYPPMSDVLTKAGITLFSGYSAANLTGLAKRPDLVVIGNVISRGNPEAEVALSGGYAYTSLPEAMEKLMLAQTRNLVVAGTHGKTTTSSLLAFVLTHAGRDPSYFIGGVSHNLPNSFQVSSLEKGKPFVLEGDEYDTAFWDKVPKFNHYLPDDAILTSVEFDHADIYADFAAVKHAFSGLVSRIRPGGRLIACFDYDAVRDLAREAKVPVLTYGSKPGPGIRFTPRDQRVDAEGMTSFTVLDDGKAMGSLRLSIPGNHNVLNALATWIEAREFGLTHVEIEAGLAAFKGVKRRQEERGEISGVLVIDDFAHHPTAVRETLRALRSKYPGRRLVSVFEPRSATSRRKVFQKDYGDAFGEADGCYIAAPYDQSKIAEGDQFSSEQLVDDIRSRGHAAECFHEVEEGVKRVTEASRKGDLVAVLSNGGFGGFIPKLLESLKIRGPR
jgi:UDP-N-acetylmuramate: L-alanyl-gamma-D-glutamyl-meso-diaminopimelate ligase